MRDVLLGTTDYTVLVKVLLTTGAPATALAHTDIDLAYARVETDNDVTTSDVTPASLSALTDAHSDWGWKEVSSSDHPGLYRLDIADAVFASGAWEAVVTVTDASGTDFYPVDIGFRLVGVDPQVANVPANVTQFNGSNATSSGGRPEVNTTHIAGSSVSTSTAQIGVNVVNFGGSAGTFASGRPEVNTSHIAGSAVSTSSAQIGVNVVNAGATAWNSGAITANSIASDAIGSAELADSAITKIIDALFLADATQASQTNSFLDLFYETYATALALLSRVGTPSNLGSGASVAANLVDIEGQTDDIGTAGAGLTAVPWNASWDTEVQSEVQDAIEFNHLDHLFAVDYDPTNKPGVATALLNELIESDGGVSQFTANALEEAPAGGGGGGGGGGSVIE